MLHMPFFFTLHCLLPQFHCRQRYSSIFLKRETSFSLRVPVFGSLVPFSILQQQFPLQPLRGHFSIGDKGIPLPVIHLDPDSDNQTQA